MKKTISLMFTLLFTFSLYARDRNPNTKQWRFWGSDAWSTTTCSDNCCTTSHFEDYYVLGINTGSTFMGYDVNCW